MPASDPQPAAQDRAGRAGLGLVLLTSGYIIMSLTDGVAKILTAEIAPGEIAWARYFFQGILAVPFVVAATGCGASSPIAFSAIWCVACSPAPAPR